MASANKPLIPGTIVRVKGGTYDGHGAKVLKIDQGRGQVLVMIEGKVRRLKMERVNHGG